MPPIQSLHIKSPMPQCFEPEPIRNAALTLPQPDKDAIAHSQKLLDLIAHEIELAGGALGFDRFMELALYAPGFGYYSAGARKFGEQGDFVTAPEISPLFAQCLANQCIQAFEHLESPSILEFGAGSGRLAVDLLTSLEKKQRLPEHYYILEVSADLKARQQALVKQEIPHLTNKVTWLKQLPSSPIQAVVIANEVLDAMPVHRFRRFQNQWQEQMVVLGDQGLISDWQSIRSPNLASAITQLNLTQETIESEINLRQHSWIESIHHCLEKGLVLLIDYGFPASVYYHESRTEGTLMCHYRHHAHANPLVYIGLQDITAHVDFTAVAKSALNSGFDVCGFSSQAFFLFSTGLDKIMADSDPNDLDKHMQLVQSVRRLTLPTEMGERFQVLGLAKNITSPSFIGFQMRDQREKL